MFDLLKKKISNFIDGITKKEEKTEPTIEKKEEIKTPEITPVPETLENQPEQNIESAKTIKEEKPQEKKETKIEKTKQEERPEQKTEEKKPRQEEPPKQKTEERKEEKTKQEEHLKKTEEKPKQEKKQPEATEKNFKPLFGIKQKISSLLTNTITLEEKNLEPVFNEFQTSLLESDVSYSTTEFMIENIKKELVGKKVDKNKVGEEVKHQVTNTLEKIFEEGGSKNFFQEIKQKPYIVLFVGTNGSGKTTTIAKIAWAAKKKGLTTVMVAADTFRKAAIEQLTEHAQNLQTPIIKRDYGADPTSVAFDAVSYAKAKGIDLVLIDTAGRQETNQNLVREMEKINRIIKPNLKIFVGESISGNTLVDQIKTFNQAIKIDGVILTKTDFDVKGGVLLSIFHELKIPIYFTANGQQYEDLKDFNPNEMINLLLSE